LQRRDNLHFPADLYLEGSDQHRGWFQSSLLASTAMNGVAPYKAVLTHGFTVDAQGKKMSKSAGNVVAPQSVMKDLGADVLRLWVAATDYRGEMNVSDEILKRTSDGYRRLRNTARFLLSNLADFNPATDSVPASELLALDRWVVDRAYHLQQEVLAAYESYQFQPIYQKILHFCSIELGGFYLDITKDRQYTVKTEAKARRSSQTAMYHVIEALTRWLAPITSYTADELWNAMPGERSESVFLETWYEGLFPLDANAEISHKTWDVVMAVRETVAKNLESKRTEGSIGSSLNAEVELRVSGNAFVELKKIESELHFVFITSKVTLIEEINPSDASEQGVVFEAKITPSEHTKCVRCWHQRPDVGTNTEHPELCGRCVENVAGAGEVRHYA